MTASNETSPTPWVDPDDAPDMSGPDWPIEDADLYHGDRLIRAGRPKIDGLMELVTLRLDHDLVTRLRESGPGWQSRVNDMLKTAVGL